MPAQNAAPQLSSGPRFPYDQLRDTYIIAGQEHPANTLFLDQPAHERPRPHISSGTLQIQLIANRPTTDQQREDLDEFFAFFAEHHAKAFTSFSIIKLLSAVASRLAQAMEGTGGYRPGDAQPSVYVQPELFKHGPAVEREYQRLHGQIIANMGRRAARSGPQGVGQGPAGQRREDAQEVRPGDGPNSTTSSENNADDVEPLQLLTELRRRVHEVAAFSISISNMMTRHFFMPLQESDTMLSDSAPDTIIPRSTYTMSMLRSRLQFSGAQLGLPDATSPAMTYASVASARQINQLTTFVNNLRSDGHIYPAEAAYILHRLDAARRGGRIPYYWLSVEFRYISILMELLNNRNEAAFTLRLLRDDDNDSVPLFGRYRTIAIRLFGSQFDSPDRAEATIRELVEALDNIASGDEAGDAGVARPTAVRSAWPTACTICLEEITRAQLESEEAGTVACGHLFHGECIDQWVSRSGRNSCPNCRARMFPLEE